MSADAPEAAVLAVHGRRVEVACPYCGNAHSHSVEHLGTPERHAPGCGMFTSPQHRLTGYWIRTEGKTR
ncbi:hypothetical protein [Actinotalea fermentans]|nr:hypothetical protein [Actinotalea fermentans]KGM17177.1 hypothetical protein N867_09220 [Actinotalea fermentans ATCC 43279 = JCM 9966 = DSM 3133]